MPRGRVIWRGERMAPRGWRKLLLEADKMRFLVGAAINPAQTERDGTPLRKAAVERLAEDLKDARKDRFGRAYVSDGDVVHLTSINGDQPTVMTTGKESLEGSDRVMKKDLNELTSDQLVSLRQGIVACFSMEELRTACFDLGMDYDSLTGDGKEGKAREIVSFLSRRGDLSRLMDYCVKMRPSYTWSWLGMPLEKPARNVDFEIEVRVCGYYGFHV